MANRAKCAKVRRSTNLIKSSGHFCDFKVIETRETHAVFKNHEMECSFRRKNSQFRKNDSTGDELIDWLILISEKRNMLNAWLSCESRISINHRIFATAEENRIEHFAIHWMIELRSASQLRSSDEPKKIPAFTIYEFNHVGRRNSLAKPSSEWKVSDR